VQFFSISTFSLCACTHAQPPLRHHTVRCEELAHCSECVELQLSGLKLPNKDGLFGKSDPFYTVSRLKEDGSWLKVHTSETVMNNLSPDWKCADISVQVCTKLYSPDLLYTAADSTARTLNVIILSDAESTATVRLYYELYSCYWHTVRFAVLLLVDSISQVRHAYQQTTAVLHCYALLTLKDAVQW
jgi:hypothetical protein